ncbi:hypothetical protein ACFZBU_42355 [Embleya sp. NPDC008237]|uniref:hypothetical protein n=1 Tax=Embleya sp. NPDC008237 TaxID=3363978 RepID=UPI0036EFBAB1
MSTSRPHSPPTALTRLANTATARHWNIEVQEGAGWWALTMSALVRRAHDGALTQARMRAVWSGPRNRFDARASQAWADDAPTSRTVNHTAITATLANTHVVDPTREAAGDTSGGLDANAWAAQADEHATKAAAAHARATEVLARLTPTRARWAAAAKATVRAHLDTAAQAAESARDAAARARTPGPDAANARTARQLAELASRHANTAHTETDLARDAVLDAEAEHVTTPAVARAQTALDREAAQADPTLSAADFAKRVIGSIGNADERFQAWHDTNARRTEGYSAAWDRWCAASGQPPRAETYAWLLAHTAQKTAIQKLGMAAIQHLADTPAAECLRALTTEAQALTDGRNPPTTSAPSSSRHGNRRDNVRSAIAATLDRNTRGIVAGLDLLVVADTWARQLPAESRALREATLIMHGIDQRRRDRRRRHLEATGPQT